MKLGLLFDFDGTLVDTSYAHEIAFIKAFDHFNVTPKNFCYQAIKGMTTLNVLETYGVDVDSNNFLKIKSIYFDQNLSACSLLVDIGKLNHLRKNGHILSIVTGSRLITVKKVLANKEFKNIFSNLITCESFMYSKPNPAPYLTAIKKSGKLNCIAIEDSSVGLESATKAGLITVGVHDASIKNECDYYFSDINNFLDILI